MWNKIKTVCYIYFNSVYVNLGLYLHQVDIKWKSTFHALHVKSKYWPLAPLFFVQRFFKTPVINLKKFHPTIMPCFINSFFFSSLATPRPMEFQDQRSDLSHSWNLPCSCSCSHTRSLTRCAGQKIKSASQHSSEADPIALQQELPNTPVLGHPLHTLLVLSLLLALWRYW